MDEVIEKVMRTYTLMMVILTPAEERAARERLEQFLEGKSNDPCQLAVEGVKFLRERPSIADTACLIPSAKFA